MKKQAEGSWLIAAPAPSPKWRGTAALAALLFAATLVVYWQVRGAGFFIADDGAYVKDRPEVMQGISLQNFAWSFRNPHWVPLTWLSWMLDTSLQGPEPGGYHWTNVLLHAANAVLLFVFLVVATGSRAKSAVVAALFALHPLHVESVAWISERKDVLSTLFGLVSLVMYVLYTRTGRWLSLGGCLLFFVASLMSKSTLVTLPFVFLLLDYWPLGRFTAISATRPAPSSPRRRGARPIEEYRSDSAVSRRHGPARKLVVEKLPFFAISAAYSPIAFLVQSHLGAVQPGSALPLGTRCLNAVVVYATYLWKTVNPQKLSVYYPYPHDGLGWTTVVPAAALLLVISAAAIIYLRRFPYVFVGWCWYLGTLVPMIGVVQIGSQQMADRFTYFPLVGIFLAVVWLVPAVTPDGVLRTKVLPVATIAGLVLLASITFSQVSYWHDSVTLVRHSMDCTSDCPTLHEYLAAALFEEGRMTESAGALQEAVRETPSDPRLRFQWGIALDALGRADAAMEQYRKAVALDDGNAEAHNRLGADLLGMGQFDAAERQFDRALDIDPGCTAARINQALLSLKKGDYAEAISRSEKELAHDPPLPIFHHFIVKALRAQGRTDEAVRRLRKLIEIAPDDKEAQQELAEMLGAHQGASR